MLGDVDAMHFNYAVRCEPRQMSPTRLIIGGRLSPRRRTSRNGLNQKITKHHQQQSHLSLLQFHAYKLPNSPPKWGYYLSQVWTFL